MHQGWMPTRIGDICKTNQQTYSVSEKWPFVNYLDTGNITENRVSEIQHLVTGQDTLPSRARRKVAVDDILYSTVRPNQRHYGIVKEVLPNMLVSTGFAVITADKAVADSDFLYYYLTQNDIVDSLHAIGEQSVSAYPSIKPSDIESLEMLLPPLDEQIEIGRTLRALDDKIANNKAINHHLEQMAQTIFKSWFVDFEPWGGVMPDDWREVPLGGVVEMSTKALNPQSCPDTVLEHYSIPAFDETRLPVFEAAAEIKSNKYIVDKDCFLISKLNPTTKRIWRPCCISKHAVCSTEFIVYRAKNPAHKDFYYSVIDSPAFTDFLLSHITGSTGSRQRAIPRETLSFSVIVPPDDIIEDFCDKVAAIYAHFEQNHLESRRLRQIRDSLLPRLMSGELSVADLGDAK
ncbi:Restriction modification system DNA specificity domain protein [uncultured spirochete]|uniref:Restriction modification system DNA specificity domain protein n=1 Tax=uncultured spirochete TaxID=156406 RepID=A0A3P3XPX4_9SPIR|nr:Restriction modification system DNA specificity domain protein [uncultured spirochete]